MKTKRKPLILKEGKVSEVDAETEEIVGAPVFYSGLREIETDKTVCIEENFQSITFIDLCLNGTLELEGDLWLA